MIGLPASVRIYLYTAPCDMRRGFDGLKALAEHGVGINPLGGDLFVFCSRRADRMKILYWDRDGYAIWMKRLERGTFELPRVGNSESLGVKITASQLSLILEGIELSSVRRRKRFQLRSAG